MSVTFSTAVFDSMGFVPLPEGEAIEAVFHSFHVFAARGFTLHESGVTTLKSAVSGTNYEIGVGNSVNAITGALLGTPYTEDEPTWSTEHRCTPPYAVIHFGPTALQTVTAGRVKRDGTGLYTYDAFGAAKDELRRLEAAALPTIEMALACEFGSGSHAVRFVSVDHAMFGLTPDNATVHDVRLTVRATGYVSRPLAAGEIEAKLNSTASVAAALDSRVARFFQLGLRESDDVKKFLYHFLAIEIETHNVFRSSSAAVHLKNGAILEPRARESLSLLLESRDNWKSLADRFIWCVVSTWKHLSDADIREFKRLKKIRDAIAHGALAAPEPDAVLAVEHLARRIHGLGQEEA